MNTTNFQYDAGDLTTITNALGQRFARFIDSAGRMLSLNDSIGQKGQIEYNALNQPMRVTDSLQGVTSFGYDPNGNLLSVTHARNNTTGYIYDNMDRVATRTDPLSRQESYLYDANGNLRQVTDRKNQVTSYTYDSFDRLTLITFADLSTTSFAYDNANRLIEVVDSISGTISYGYDNFDRVTSETGPQGSVNYTYDAAGRCETLSVPGQDVVSYTYDNADRLTRITQGTSAVDIGYDNAGRRILLSLPNGVVSEYGYDSLSRLATITYKKGAATLGTLTYEYDAASRLSKLGGNFARTGLPQPVSTTNYNSANQQTVFGAQSLTYDNNGNLISDGINNYGWNVRNQLVAVSGPSVAATFEYDALGRRIGKGINGAMVNFLYDRQNVVQEQVGGAATTNILTGGVDEVFTRTDATGSMIPLADTLGSTLALTDNAGTLQTQYTYEPFGQTSGSGLGSSNTQQYIGRENDGTGLYYYRSRYYSPRLQRFISEDPIGFLGGDIDLYVYVGNSPILHSDRQGLERPNSAAGTLPSQYRPIGGSAAPIGGRKNSPDSRGYRRYLEGCKKFTKEPPEIAFFRKSAGAVAKRDYKQAITILSRGIEKTLESGKEVASDELLRSFN